MNTTHGPRNPPTSQPSRLQGEWYWVTDGKKVWTACHDHTAAGGWTNQDTWEDFDGKVISWQHIARPELESFWKAAPPKHDHRQSLWLIAGGAICWCYRCGAWRRNTPEHRKWHKPTGPQGENPAMQKGFEI